MKTVNLDRLTQNKEPVQNQKNKKPLISFKKPKQEETSNLDFLKTEEGKEKIINVANEEFLKVQNKLFEEQETQIKNIKSETIIKEPSEKPVLTEQNNQMSEEIIYEPEETQNLIEFDEPRKSKNETFDNELLNLDNINIDELNEQLSSDYNLINKSIKDISKDIYEDLVKSGISGGASTLTENVVKNKLEEIFESIQTDNSSIKSSDFNFENRRNLVKPDNYNQLRETLFQLCKQSIAEFPTDDKEEVVEISINKEHLDQILKMKDISYEKEIAKDGLSKLNSLINELGGDTSDDTFTSDNKQINDDKTILNEEISANLNDIFKNSDSVEQNTEQAAIENSNVVELNELEDLKNIVDTLKDKSLEERLNIANTTMNENHSEEKNIFKSVDDSVINENSTKDNELFEDLTSITNKEENTIIFNTIEDQSHIEPQEKIEIPSIDIVETQEDPKTNESNSSISMESLLNIETEEVSSKEVPLDLMSLLNDDPQIESVDDDVYSLKSLNKNSTKTSDFIL